MAMASRYLALALGAALIAAPLAAEPRIEIAITGPVIDLTMTDATPAEALARLSEAVGFTVEGAEALPATKLSMHLKGPVDRIIAALADPANRIAIYASDDPSRMVRLVLLANGGRPILSMQSAAAPADLPPGDPALGGSRRGSDAVRTQLHSSLGLTLP